jgi:hypothetical protein
MATSPAELAKRLAKQSDAHRANGTKNPTVSRIESFTIQ